MERMWGTCFAHQTHYPGGIRRIPHTIGGSPTAIWWVTHAWVTTSRGVRGHIGRQKAGGWRLVRRSSCASSGTAAALVTRFGTALAKIVGMRTPQHRSYRSLTPGAGQRSMQVPGYGTRAVQHPATKQQRSPGTRSTRLVGRYVPRDNGASCLGLQPEP